MLELKINTALRAEVKRLLKTKPIEGEEYYQISLVIDEDGKLQLSMTSRWVGFTNTTPRREIRQASLVIPNAAIKVFRSIRQPVFVVNNTDDLKLFMFLLGGHAIIRKALTKKYLKEFLSLKHKPSLLIKDLWK